MWKKYLIGGVAIITIAIGASALALHSSNKSDSQPADSVGQVTTTDSQSTTVPADPAQPTSDNSTPVDISTPADNTPVVDPQASPPAPVTVTSTYYCYVSVDAYNSNPFKVTTYSDGTITVQSYIDNGPKYEQCPNNQKPQSNP